VNVSPLDPQDIQAAGRATGNVKLAQERALDPTSPPEISGPAAIYHGPSDPTSGPLPGLGGGGGALQITNTGKLIALYDKSADLLTNGVGNDAFDLLRAYRAALSQLPTALQQKDWSFSIADGKLVFKSGRSALTAADLNALNDAFGKAKVAAPASRLASDVVTSIELRRQAGADSGSLGWGRFQVDRTNFAAVVDLRDFITSVAPGGRYNENLICKTDDTSVRGFVSGWALMQQIAANATELTRS
jgi:hypothetical protein